MSKRGLKPPALKGKPKVSQDRPGSYDCFASNDLTKRSSRASGDGTVFSDRLSASGGSISKTADR